MDRKRYCGLIAGIKIGLIFIMIQNTFSSCTKKKKDVEYFENNKIKKEHFFSNGYKDSSRIYSKSGNHTSTLVHKEDKKLVRYFYENGTIEAKGIFIEDSIPLGEWRYYDKQGNLTEIKDFLIIENRPILNQNWVLDLRGDTIKDKSNYFELIMEKDTIFLSEPIKAKVDLIAPFFKDKNSSIMVVIAKDYSIDFNDDFSNKNEVKKDTTFNLNLEKDMRGALGLESDFRRTCIFGKYFNDIGSHKLRGIIVEYYYTENAIPDSLGNNYYEKMQYFELPVYVKDTIQ